MQKKSPDRLPREITLKRYRDEAVSKGRELIV
jgi:hypothetical protein